MANERFPDDPFRSNLSDDDFRRQARLDNELQPDPELAEGPASGAKVAMFAVAIALVLGAIFYGLNNTTINQAGTSSTAQNTSQTSPPAAPRMSRTNSHSASLRRGDSSQDSQPRSWIVRAVTKGNFRKPAESSVMIVSIRFYSTDFGLFIKAGA